MILIGLKIKQKDEDDDAKKIKSKYKKKYNDMFKAIKSEEEEELRKSKLSLQSTTKIGTEFKAARKDLLDNLCDNCRLFLNDSNKSGLFGSSKTSKSNHAGTDSYSGSTLPNMKGQSKEQITSQYLVLVTKLQDQVKIYHSKASEAEQKNAFLEGDIKRLHDQLEDFKAKVSYYESSQERKENRITELEQEIDEVKSTFEDNKGKYEIQISENNETLKDHEEEICKLHEELSSIRRNNDELIDQQKEFDSKTISYNASLQSYKDREKSSYIDQQLYTNTKKELDITKNNLETMETKSEELEKRVKILERENRNKETETGMTKLAICYLNC